MNVTTDLNRIAAGRVLDGSPAERYGRPVRPTDLDDVESAYRLFHDRLTDLLASLASEGHEPKLLLNWLPNLYEVTDDLAELRDFIEEGGPR